MSSASCSITKGSSTKPIYRKPVPKKILPPNNSPSRSPRNSPRNSPRYSPHSPNNGNKKKKNGVYEINFTPKSDNKNGKIKHIEFGSKNAKPLPPNKPKTPSPIATAKASAKPSFNTYKNNNNQLKQTKLYHSTSYTPQPQKPKYHSIAPKKSLTPTSVNNNINYKNVDDNDDDDFDDNDFMKNIHRVKNRPAQTSIAGKLAQQQKKQQKNALYEKQEEEMMKKRTKQHNKYALPTAAAFKK